ncbi:hypothetical protein Tco_0304898, partial [Tanacetum coccineum]
RNPALSFMRPFGCPVTILNTIDHLGKFNGKADEGFFKGYYTNSKAFRVFNSRTRIVEENPHVQFSENTPNIAGSGPNWLFDIDALTKSMNYKPVVIGNQSNSNACTKACDDAGKARIETVPGTYYILLPLWTQDPPFSSSSKDSPDAGFKPSGEEEKKDAEDITVNAVGIEDNVVDENIVYGCVDDPNMPDLEDIGSSENEVVFGVEADMTNLDTHILISPIPTTRIHKDHPVEQIIRDIHSAPQTRRMTKSVTGHAMYALTVNPTIYVSYIEQFWSTAKAKTINEETQIHAIVDGKKIVITQSSIRSDLQLADDDGIDLFHHHLNPKRLTELGKPKGPLRYLSPVDLFPLLQMRLSLRSRKTEWKRLPSTTASSLEAMHDNGNINRTQSMATLNQASPQGTGSGSGPRVNTLGSGEGRLKLKELMDLCTKLSDRVLDLETTKTAQAKSIFEESDFDDEDLDAVMDKAIEHVYEADKDVERDAEQVISADAVDVSTGDAVTTASVEVNTASAPSTTACVSVSTVEPITTASVNITIVEPSTPLTTTTTVIEDEDLTIAQTLMKMKSEKSKVRGVVMKEPSETDTRPIVPPQQHDPKDKAQMQAELEEEERLVRQREKEASIAEWNDV